MRDFTRDQLWTLNMALRDYATAQANSAEHWRSEYAKDPALAVQVREAGGMDLPTELYRTARVAARMAHEAAMELHRRGVSDCGLAHPGERCPFKKEG